MVHQYSRGPFDTVANGTPGVVMAVSSSTSHTFSKQRQRSVTLLRGFGVQGDAHAGQTIQHQSRLARNASAPNVRQVHLMTSEVQSELRDQGYDVAPGDLGENITTAGMPLLELPTGTLLRVGVRAVVEVTGLRNPCKQLDGRAPGLMAALLGRDNHGGLVRKAGVMSIVREGGVVNEGDPIVVEHPPLPHVPLQCV
jgi:MOSC domain-containing protein YiiM